MVKNLTLSFPVDVNGKTGINGREFNKSAVFIFAQVAEEKLELELLLLSTVQHLSLTF